MQNIHLLLQPWDGATTARPSGGTTGAKESDPRAQATIDSSCRWSPTPSWWTSS